MAGFEDRPLRSDCPIAASLDLIGDRWTLLVLRDVLVAERSRFNEFATDEGIATSTLTDRLDRLVDADLLARVPDENDGRRVRYLPRSAALDLIPALVDLMAWGSTHAGGERPPFLTDTGAASRAAAVELLTDQARRRVVDH